MPDILINVSKQLGKAVVIGETPDGAAWMRITFNSIAGTYERPLLYIEEEQVHEYGEQVAAADLVVDIKYT